MFEVWYVDWDFVGLLGLLGFFGIGFRSNFYLEKIASGRVLLFDTDYHDYHDYH